MARMTRRQKRLIVRLLLAAAVATMIVVRYTSPKTVFQPWPPERTRQP